MWVSRPHVRRVFSLTRTDKAAGFVLFLSKNAGSCVLRELYDIVLKLASRCNELKNKNSSLFYQKVVIFGLML